MARKANFASADRPVVLGGVALCLGCSGPSLPAVAPVTGTVTWQGQPVADAEVLFMPKGSRPANGTTDSQGHYKLSTFGQGDGAVIGQHAVTVTKRVAISDAPYSPERSEIPEQYSGLTTSDLKADVTAAGPNEFNFDLVGKIN